MIKVMKCIHLNPKKINIQEYFQKRSLHVLYTQPKYNGIRASWYHNVGLYSRGGHLITSVPHIVAELELFSPTLDLDGELWHPTMSFNDINGAARRIEPTFSSLTLGYQVFDQIDCCTIQQDRLQANKAKLEKLPENSFIKEAPFCKTTPGHLDYMLKVYLKQGFEGMIIRAPNSLYKEERHVGNIWAIKPEYEVEATFLGFLPPGKGTSLHQDTFGSLLLKLPSNGRTFSCSGITEMDRCCLYHDDDFIRGTEVTIKFGAWSQEDKEKAVPLYPRFKCIRWDK